MNKKFSTLLAGLVLAVSSVSAATTVDQNIKLKEDSNDGLFQIAKAGTDSVLMARNDSLVFVKATDVKIDSLAYSLWCIHIDKQVQGQAPKFDFTNKGESWVLSVDKNILSGRPAADVSDSLMVDDAADLNGWAFSTTYKDGVETEKPLYSYFSADSVIALVVEPGGKALAARKYLASTDELASIPTKFTLQKPGRLTLNAKALNTLLGIKPTSTSFKLTFDKKADSNVFANELVAVKDTSDASGSFNDYVILANKSTGKYLRVDTAYNNTTGIGFIQLTDTTKATTYQKEEGSIDTKHYAFKFEYEPSSDSVIITVAGARLVKPNNGYWSAAPIVTKRDTLHVYIQDLVKSSVLTVGKDSSKIKLGFGTCAEAPAPTKATVKSDLYVIKGAKGKYLAAPIYGDTTIQWVTLEKNVNPWAMPSFQWVVEKVRESETSPIKLTNREFEIVLTQPGGATSFQLEKSKGLAVKLGAIEDSLYVGGFEAATAAIKADSLLGYKYLDTMDLKVTRYKFRYLHEFSDEHFVGVNEEVNDSILYVGAKSPFSLKSVNSTLQPYGATSKKIDGLKKLYRQAYTLKIQNSKLVFGAKVDNVGLDKEGRFSVSKYLRPDTFLIKANNEKAIDEKVTPFYAFVKVNRQSAGDTTKVAVDGNNLWLKNELMTESRTTSAFSVEVDDSPLYRRFNTTKEGEKATDDPDTVKFFRANNPADMMFEDAYSVYSKDLNINYWGVSNSVQFPDVERAIYVDTAYVNRGTGYIKPQYMLAVGVTVTPGSDAVPCPLDHNHGFDKDGKPLDKYTCSHATPGTDGYVRGRYLINAVDSAKVDGDYTKADRDKNYIKFNQVRLAFVEAIHKGDTLYILKGDTAKLADPVDLSKIGSKIRLDNNNHKNVVFSFRLIEEGNDDFLIESAATNNEPSIAPMKGGWVKVQNGVALISYGAFDDAPNEAEIFNVAKTTDAPTANEGIAASTEVSVQTVAGGVVIRNAAGKSVTISNILGKQVAKSVLTSDNETIDVPAGIVVVAVEGEEAVKAIVK